MAARILRAGCMVSRRGAGIELRGQGILVFLDISPGVLAMLMRNRVRWHSHREGWEDRCRSCNFSGKELAPPNHREIHSRSAALFDHRFHLRQLRQNHSPGHARSARTKLEVDAAGISHRTIQRRSGWNVLKSRLEQFRRTCHGTKKSALSF